MTDETISWLVLALAAMGVIAAIAAFLKTPKERRFRGYPPLPLEEQVKAFPESSQAVIIKGNKRRTLVKFAPYILICIAMVGYSIWAKNISHPECTRLMGINVSYITLLYVCYGLPIALFLVSLAYVGTGIKTVKTGRFPPLDAVVFNDTISKKGGLSTFRGVLILVLPLFSLFVVYLGNNAYSEIAKERSMREITEKMEAKCQ